MKNALLSLFNFTTTLTLLAIAFCFIVPHNVEYIYNEQSKVVLLTTKSEVTVKVVKNTYMNTLVELNTGEVIELDTLYPELTPGPATLYTVGEHKMFTPTWRGCKIITELADAPEGANICTEYTGNPGRLLDLVLGMLGGALMFITGSTWILLLLYLLYYIGYNLCSSN